MACVCVLLTSGFDLSMLSQTLEGLACQDFDDYELLLLCQNDNPQFRSFCETQTASDPRIHPLFSAPCCQAAAWNLGLQEARGRYLIFMQAGDLPRPDYLGHMVHTLEENAADIAVCGWEIMDSAHENKTCLLPLVLDATAGTTILTLLPEEHGVCYSGLPGKLFKSELWNGLTLNEANRWPGEEALDNIYWETSRVASLPIPLFCKAPDPDESRFFAPESCFDKVENRIDRYMRFGRSRMPRTAQQAAMKDLCLAYIECSTLAKSNGGAALTARRRAVRKRMLLFANRIQTNPKMSTSLRLKTFYHLFS